jgi:hypothetical protein
MFGEFGKKKHFLSLLRAFCYPLICFLQYTCMLSKHERKQRWISTAWVASSSYISSAWCSRKKNGRFKHALSSSIKGIQPRLPISSCRFEQYYTAHLLIHFVLVKPQHYVRLHHYCGHQHWFQLPRSQIAQTNTIQMHPSVTLLLALLAASYEEEHNLCAHRSCSHGPPPASASAPHLIQCETKTNAQEM